MDSVMASLISRQVVRCNPNVDGSFDDEDCYVPFWYTKTGVIVKWSLFLGLIVFIGLYLLLGYIHAQKRIQKGLAPLGYHRFLVSRAQLARVDPRYRFPEAEAAPYYYNQQQQYYMHAMPPPPVYDPNSARPPMYPGPPPPEGSTKVDPSQQQPVAGDFAAPPGPPPPSTLPAQNTGSNPYRL
ncbi:hypothetical protein OQA88_4182 [Cercophora sp. LCS_1]